MLILFGTEACHLCEEAQLLLSTVLAETTACMDVSYIDIAEQEQWQEKYAVRIPVLLHQESGEELSWPFDHDALVQFLGRLHTTQCF